MIRIAKPQSLQAVDLNKSLKVSDLKGKVYSVATRMLSGSPLRSLARRAWDLVSRRSWVPVKLQTMSGDRSVEMDLTEALRQGLSDEAIEHFKSGKAVISDAGIRVRILEGINESTGQNLTLDDVIFEERIDGTGVYVMEKNQKPSEGCSKRVYTVYKHRFIDSQITKKVCLKFKTELDRRDFTQENAIARKLAKMPMLANHARSVAVVRGKLWVQKHYGMSLQSRLSSGSVTKAQAIKIALNICAGVKAMNKKKVIHRDIHWGNIFGEGVIGDFGSAQDNATTEQLGVNRFQLGAVLHRMGQHVKGLDFSRVTTYIMNEGNGHTPTIDGVIARLKRLQ